MSYPTMEEEIQILERIEGKTQNQMLELASPIIQRNEIAHYRSMIHDIKVEPKLVQYIATIVQETRNNPALYLGASTRASIALLKVSKAAAAIKGRDFVIPEDVIEMAPHVLRHRIMLSPEKEMEGLTPDDLIEAILKDIEIPR